MHQLRPPCKPTKGRFFLTFCGEAVNSFVRMSLVYARPWDAHGAAVCECCTSKSYLLPILHLPLNVVLRQRFPDSVHSVRNGEHFIYMSDRRILSPCFATYTIRTLVLDLVFTYIS